MGLLTRIKEWASTGAKVQPSDSYIANGWLYLVRPPRQYWNWVENARDKLINRVLAFVEARGTASPAGGFYAFCSRLGTSWSDPKQTPNYLSTGTVIKDSCFGWDAAGELPVLYVLQGNDIYPVTGAWEYDANPVRGSALSISYPSTPVDVMSICSDGSYLYVVWAATGGNLTMTKLDLATWTGSPVWNADLGIAYSNVDPEKTKSTIGNETTVAVVAFSLSGTIPVIYVVNAASGVVAAGNGNWSGTTFFLETGAEIVSDGSEVFIVIADLVIGDYVFKLGSASLSDPTTSPYSPRTIATVDSAAHHYFPTGLAIVNGHVVMANMVGNLYMFSEDRDSLDPILDLLHVETQTFDDKGPLLASDDLGLWYYQRGYYYVETGDNAFMLRRIPSGVFDPRARVTTSPPREATVQPIVIDADAGSDGVYPGRLLSDSRDMWLVTQAGDIFRTVNTLAR